MNVRAGLVVLLLLLALPASALACPDAILRYADQTYAPGDVVSLNGDGFSRPAPSVSVTLVWRSRDGSRLETLATVPVTDGDTLPPTTITIPDWAGPGDTLRADAYDQSGQLNGLSNRALLKGFQEPQPSDASTPAAEQNAPASTPTATAQTAPAQRKTAPAGGTPRPHGSRNVPKRESTVPRAPASPVTRTPTPRPAARTAAPKAVAAPVAPAPVSLPSHRGRAQTERPAPATMPRDTSASAPALPWRLRHDDAPASAPAPNSAHGRAGNVSSTTSTPGLPLVAMLLALLLAAGGGAALVMRHRRDGGLTPGAAVATMPERDRVEAELQAIIAATPATTASDPSPAENEDSRTLAFSDA